jgi:hypothetical protein
VLARYQAMEAKTAAAIADDLEAMKKLRRDISG